MSGRPLEIIRLGLMDYSEALELMKERVQACTRKEVSDALFLVEHKPVLTLGRRTKFEHILLSKQALEAQGIQVYETERGGDVTYHGPGQLVGYPVLSLEPDRRDVRRYVSDLEQLMIDVCESYGVSATRVPGLTGTWVRNGEAKIGAIGVRISRWITSHGFALNVDPNLSHFSFIVPCGISDRGVTSLSQEVGRVISVGEVSDRIEGFFRRKFGDRPPRT